MSLDTITRLESYISDNFADVYDRYVVYETQNENLRDQNSGPFVKVYIEVDSDGLTGIKTGEKMYSEFGSIIFQIFDESGSGTRDLYTIVTELRDSMRDKLIYPTGSEEGVIHLQDMEGRSSAIDVRDGSINWKRKDVFIGFKKYYDV